MPGEKLRSGYLTPAFSRAQTRAEVRCSPYILGSFQSMSQNPKQKERKSEVSVPFVNRPFESEIHGTVNFTPFCCVLPQLGAIVCFCRATFAQSKMQQIGAI